MGEVRWGKKREGCSSVDTFSDGITKARLLPLPI